MQIKLEIDSKMHPKIVWDGTPHVALAAHGRFKLESTYGRKNDL